MWIIQSYVTHYLGSKKMRTVLLALELSSQSGLSPCAVASPRAQLEERRHPTSFPSPRPSLYTRREM